MVKATIAAGVCGFKTTVNAVSDDMRNVTFQIESDCENIMRLVSDLPSVDSFSEIGLGFDGVIYTRARSALKGCCSGCVIPSGIFKAMQVAAGLALPARASIEITQEE